ncbi:MAG: hypothetical protein Fur003_2630 [Candidatus Dojkabacteria bacterium]
MKKMYTWLSLLLGAALFVGAISFSGSAVKASPETPEAGGYLLQWLNESDTIQIQTSESVTAHTARLALNSEPGLLFQYLVYSNNQDLHMVNCKINGIPVECNSPFDVTVNEAGLAELKFDVVDFSLPLTVVGSVSRDGVETGGNNIYAHDAIMFWEGEAESAICLANGESHNAYLELFNDDQQQYEFSFEFQQVTLTQCFVEGSPVTCGEVFFAESGSDGKITIEFLVTADYFTPDVGALNLMLTRLDPHTGPNVVGYDNIQALQCPEFEVFLPLITK